MGGYAWVTLATNDAYCLGALVLAHSLRRVGTKYELAVLITPGVTQTMREKLSTVFSVVMEVNVLDSKDEANLALLARPELGITFTKLHCWRLTQYDKCVFLDADTLVVRNCDELFEREELSAAPDVGWPDCFNSGVFVYKPSQQTFASITAFAAAKGSFDGGDQGLLNMYFSDWATKDISNHLPFIYNMCSTATYSYLPAFKQFGDDVRIIHFIGITKPWLQYFDTLTGIVQPPPGSTHLQPLLQLWWNIFCESVHSQLSPVMATSTLAPIWHEFTPVPFQHPTPLRSSTYTDTTDRTQNDIYVQPDFSEFQDPWENYLTRNNSIIHETEDNVTQQYYSTTNTCSPAPTFVNQTHYEPPTEHGRTHYQQQYIEPLHIQHNHNQEQISDYVNNETEQQHSYFHPSDTSVSNARHTWHNRPSVPVYNVQNHHSNESQHQHVDHHHQYISPMSHYDNNNTLSSEETREHKHVDYQSVYQQNSFNNNESPSEEVIKRQQHNEHYVDCNHYKTSNSEQFNHHYKKENNESVNIKTDHDRPVDDNNIAHKNDHLTERKAVRNKNVNFTDERTKTSVSFSPIPNSKPCTDIHKVATQSDLHVMDDLSNSNGGLAGALAQMTLGEPRSAEQIALEEHMRKQSWEQGHIDYMGRDSFDNIWKKICETLALAPSRLPSPPKETEKPAKTATDKTDSIKDDSIISSDTTQSIESVDEADKGAGAEATPDSEEQSLVNNVPITSVPKLSETNEQVKDTISSVKESEDDITEKISVEPGNETLDANISMQTSNKQILELDACLPLKETPQQTTAPIVSSDPIQPVSIGEQETITETRQLESDVKDVGDLKTTYVVDTEQTKQANIKDEIHSKELCPKESTASQILTVSPVPIQVAESVLQVEPKESMPDSRVTPQEAALFSTITSVLSVETEDKTCSAPSTTDPAQSEETFSSNKTATAENIDTATKSSEPLTESKETLQNISLSVGQIQPQLSETPMSFSGDIKTPEESMQKEGIETEVEGSEAVSGTGTAMEDEKTKTLSAGKAPVRPSRSKEVPSPSVSKTAQQDVKSEDKAVKKPVKKPAGKSMPAEESAEAAEGDGFDKKTEKKVMKKVVKKTKSKSEEGLDDGADDNNSGSKQKKTVKVVKKSTKPSQSSSIETSVPETPSSSTSDAAPVPPKRKTKPVTSKSIGKKSDTQ